MLIAAAITILIFAFLISRLIAAILTNAERHNLSDDLTYGDWPHVPTIENPTFHNGSDTL